MNSSLECSICCEAFDDQKLCPRLLSCGHSFCSGCLGKLIPHDSITCPTCRKSVAVSGGVSGLPKNFALLDVMLTAPEQESEKLCETCADERTHPATSSCLDCKEWMCGEAARWHTRNKANREHRVVSLEELKANPKLAAVPVFCLEHNEPSRFFDEDCGIVVCRDCVTLKHNGHKCLSLAEAASKYRVEMEALAAKATVHAKEIAAAEDRVVNMTRDLNNMHQQQTAVIHDAFEKLHAAIAAREQALLNDLGQHHKTKGFTLSEQRDQLSVFQACLESAVQRVDTAVKSSSDAQLLAARSDVTSTLAALAAQPPALYPQADDKLHVILDLEQLLDVLSTAGDVSDSSTCAANTTATGLGLERAESGQPASFTITARDSHGDLRGVGGDAFEVALGNERGERLHIILEDIGDGTYVASYTLPAWENTGYTVSVLLRGRRIRGSPFQITCAKKKSIFGAEG